MSYNTVSFPGGASPSYPPSHLPPQHAAGRYSPQPGYQQPLAGGYAPNTGYAQQAQAQPGYPSPTPQPGMMAPSQAASPAGGQQPITPGSITYTTSAGPDGRVVYHPFKAVPASYQTPQGVVSGIQWIPAEATNVVPAGAQPADAGFAASWNRGHLSEDDKRSIEKWQRDEEKRRRRDEKEAAKRVHEWENQRREREKAEEREDRELRKARERDSGVGHRERRRSTNGPPIPGGYGVPTTVPIGALPGVAGTMPGGYAGSGYERERKYSTGGSPELSRGMEQLALGGGGGGGAYGTRERKNSTGFAMPRSRRGSMNAGVLEAAIRAGNAGSDSSDRGGAYGNRGYGAGGGYGAAPNAYGGAVPGRPLSRAPSPYHSPMPNRSPLPGESMLPNAPVYGVPATYGAPDHGHNRRASTDPYARPVSPYAGPAGHGADGTYPRGHVLEGQPIPRSPIPGVAASAAYTTQVPGYAGSGGGYPGGGGGGYAGSGGGHAGSGVGYAGSGGSSVGMPPIVGYPSGSRPPSRLAGSNMPAPYGAAGMDQGQGAMMAPPEGFSRPPNRSQPYTAFDPVRIQAMDELVEHMPRMPMVLMPHDVLHPDWIRFMTDISFAWQDPGRVGRTRPASAVADLIELWNSQFFLPRSAEIVLYKGAERRTGPDAGSIDREVLAYDEFDASSSSEEEDDDSDVSDRGYGAGAGGYGGMYGRGADSQMAQMREARRARRAEAKAEKRRRRKEKKMRRRAREQEKTYSLYVMYAPAGAGGEGGPRAPLYVGM